MKIIVNDEKEKQEFLEVSKYLHDFTIYVEDKNKKCSIKIIKRFGRADGSIKPIVEVINDKDFDISLDLSLYPLLNYLAHLYVTPNLIEIRKD